jgi:hypothetical protein
MLEKLKLVPGFKEYLDLSYRLTVASSAPLTPGQRPDPVTLLWTCFRHGSSLCHLMNFHMPGTVPEAHRPEDTTDNVNLAKANIYYFWVACRDKLGFPADQLFSITELYKGQFRIMRGYPFTIKWSNSNCT